MSERECPVCRVTKPFALFAKDRRLRFGIARICHACKMESVARGKRAKYHSDPAVREKGRLNDQNRLPRPRDVHPVKQRAWRAMKSAINSGQLQRPDKCEDCGVECVPHGHHEDYSKPLAVVWLCHACHAKRHRKYADKTHQLSANGEAAG